MNCAKSEDKCFFLKEKKKVIGVLIGGAASVVLGIVSIIYASGQKENRLDTAEIQLLRVEGKIDRVSDKIETILVDVATLKAQKDIRESKPVSTTSDRAIVSRENP